MSKSDDKTNHGLVRLLRHMQHPPHGLNIIKTTPKAVVSTLAARFEQDDIGRHGCPS